MMKYPDALIEHFAIYRIIKRRQNSSQKKISLKELERKMKKEASKIREGLYWQKSAEKRDKTFSQAKALSHKKIWKS